MKKAFLALLVAGALAAAGRYFPVDFLKPSIERALERSLGRKVDIGSVYLNALGDPGFTVEDVTIHEDARAGIEPAAYTTSMNVGVRFLPLFTGHIEFSGIRLGDASFNLVRTPSGVWSFQYLLGGGSEGLPSVNMPPIKMRGGRLNLKYADTKSVFFFEDADLDVDGGSDGTVNFRFGGLPARTDRSARDFGHLFLRGTWTTVGEPKLNVEVELERSAVNEVAKIVDPDGIGLAGTMRLDARMSGPPSSMDITGTLRLEDLRQADLLPQKGSWTVAYSGKLDLHGETMRVKSAAAPVVFELQVASLLSGPQIDASAHLENLSLGQGIDAMRRLGLGIVEGVSAEGVVKGEVSYAHSAGYIATLAIEGGPAEGKVEYRGGKWSGDVALKSLSVPVDGLADAVKIESAALSFAGDKIALKKMVGSAGKISFTGEFVWPDQLKLVASDAEGDELVRLFTPLLQLQRGFIARTLGLGSTQSPDWLSSRALHGSVAVANLDAWGTAVKLDQAKFAWQGQSLKLEDITARAGSGRVTGKIEVALEKTGPKYRFEGKATGVPIQGERRDFSGVLEASGAPRDVPNTIHKGE